MTSMKQGMSKTWRQRQTEAERLAAQLAHLERREQAHRSPFVVSSAILDRGRLFQPTTSPSLIDTYDAPVLAESTCTTQVCGRVGQTHVAVLESLWMRARWKKDVDDGALIAVRRADVLQDLSTLRDYGSDKLDALLGDLMAVRFRLSNIHDGLWNADAPKIVEGTFIRNFHSRTAKDGGRIQIEFDPAYISILRHDRAPSARSRLAVVHLRSGLSKAVARWLLSQSVNQQPRNGWYMDTVLAKLLGERTPKQRTWDRDKLRSEASEIWLRCGIKIHGASGRQPRFQLVQSNETQA